MARASDGAVLVTCLLHCRLDRSAWNFIESLETNFIQVGTNRSGDAEVDIRERSFYIARSRRRSGKERQRRTDDAGVKFELACNLKTVFRNTYGKFDLSVLCFSANTTDSSGESATRGAFLKKIRSSTGLIEIIKDTKNCTISNSVSIKSCTRAYLFIR